MRIPMFFLSCVALLLAACGTEQPIESLPPELTVLTSEVAVTGGKIRGLAGESGLKQFHGIPYAAAPTDELRWAPPASVVPWSGVRDATQPGPACMQPEGQGGSFYGQADVVMDEDCLTLNVWTRANHVESKLPVMVWVHGGALVTGSGSNYPGELLTSKGVVLVTINYRLGRLGFFAHPQLSQQHAAGVSGNQGLRDQIQALRWVQENIEQFGGDPDKVTIFGESAGSLSMSLLQASPLATGLFHRVIGQSGGAFQPMWYRALATAYAPAAETAGAEFARALVGGELGADADLTALRAVPQEEVISVMKANPEFSNYDSLAIVDGEVIPDEVATIFAQGRQADVPVLIGSNANEGTTFLEFFTPLFGEGVDGLRNYLAATLPEVVDEALEIYPATTPVTAAADWSDVFSDVSFAYPMRVWARGMENVTSEAYLYWFTWAPAVPEREKYGAFHAAEIGYVFGVLDLFGAKPTDADREMSELMSTIWTQFAKTGDPNGVGLPDWSAYSADNESFMELGIDTGSKSELRIAEMDLIERAWQSRRMGPQGQ